MSLVVVGLNHRTVPVELLERLAIAPAALPKALESLGRCEHLAEVVLLSTCNRTEVYANATLFHPAMQDVRDFLSDVSGVDPDEFSDLLYAYHDDAAVAHLFGVAAGLDSMIIGEGEILGQVREAWQAAEREEASGPLLSRTFRHAIEVGKRARTETAIGRHAVSVSSAAVSLANSRLGTLDDRRVLVLGAGEMGEGMALALAGAGVLEIVVANRTMSRGEELARRVGGRAISLDEVPAALVECDVLLVSTGATDLLMERSQVEAGDGAARRACAARRRRRRAPQHRSGRGRSVRCRPARHRRPPRARRALARATAPGDRQGARPHRRGARPSPARAVGARGRAAGHRAPRPRRGAPHARARALPIEARGARPRGARGRSRRSPRAS